MTIRYPNWPAVPQVHACYTVRQGGVSAAPYDSFNLGLHVGDDPENVQQNRARLCQLAALPQPPVWLDQVHSTKVLNLDTRSAMSGIEADASYTSLSGHVCAVMTADCLPLLFCTLAGDEVAAAHAGWRGLCQGIIENTVKQFRAPPEQIRVWLGPAIGPTAFEVGVEVKTQFEQVLPASAQAFVLSNPAQQKYLANIYLLAKLRLNALGITQIYGGEHCTFSEPEHFFSYRRHNVTGRMVSLIWIQ